MSDTSTGTDDEQHQPTESIDHVETDDELDNEIEQPTESTPDEIGSEEPASPTKGPDEVFCTSCGEPIKEEAAICPHCGVSQQSASVQTADAASTTGESSPEASTQTGATQQQHRQLPEHRVYDLQRLARKDTTTVMLVSLLITPLGYWMIGKRGLAIINFLTFNYVLTGFIIVPLHTRKIIKDARRELEKYGYGW